MGLLLMIATLMRRVGIHSHLAFDSICDEDYMTYYLN